MAQATRPADRGVAVYLVEGSGCGGCALEAQAALARRYGAPGRPIRAVGAPAHADVLVLCGALPDSLREELQHLTALLPAPWTCVHLGDCAGEGLVVEGAGTVAGCPPTPEAIREAVEAAWQRGERCRLAAAATPEEEAP